MTTRTLDTSNIPEARNPKCSKETSVDELSELVAAAEDTDTEACAGFTLFDLLSLCLLCGLILLLLILVMVPLLAMLI